MYKNNYSLYTPFKYRYNSYIIIIIVRTVFHMMEDFYMPTDIQFKDDLRKEEIKLEELLNLLKNQEYEKLQKKLERDLKRVRESLQD